jgi:uncharacterized surface protein with fasciclin (FAS1) repeats
LTRKAHTETILEVQEVSMKRIVVLLATVAAFAVAAAPGMSASMAPRQNIVQIAASSPQFSTLVKLVEQAGLAGALSGKGKLTVFAPTNAAFAKVPKKTLAKLGHDKALLKAVLLYHVVKGEVLASQIVKLHSVKTLEGASVRIRVTHGSVYVNQARVIKANVLASNGVIHIINGVLIPPS